MRLTIIGLTALLTGCNSCGAEAPRQVRTDVVKTPQEPDPSPVVPVRTSSTRRAWISTAEFPSASEVSREDGIAGLRHGPRRALVRLERIDEECSGLGGTHLFFRLEQGGPAEYVHFGGHGENLPVPSPENVVANANANVIEPKKNVFATGSLYVASFEPIPRVETEPIWCLNDLPAYERRALVLVPVNDVEEGKNLLKEVDR